MENPPWGGGIRMRNICHGFSVLSWFLCFVIYVYVLSFLKGDIGLPGPPGPVGEQGIGIPGAKVIPKLANVFLK